MLGGGSAEEVGILSGDGDDKSVVIKISPAFWLGHTAEWFSGGTGETHLHHRSISSKSCRFPRGEAAVRLEPMLGGLFIISLFAHFVRSIIIAS